MNGYPPGTKCVITWAYARKYIGETVTCLDGIEYTSVVGIDSGEETPPHWMQWVEWEGYPEPMCHPVAWMRPIDPDPQTIEEHDEVTA